MKNEQIARIQKRLLALRAEILKVIEWRDAPGGSNGAMDEIDQANELIEKEMGFVMSNNMRSNLKEVEDALERIETKHYGTCLQCGQEISPKRLEVLPFARFCVPCQEKMENRGR
ncbi:MAG: TraR/DksA C4-type zinc finger protein [Candidatus Aminicenantes bacterium]|nr:TraR/DksA C4-type zinc finger protein [Candidatus Aminicenantes bacterium]